MENKIKIGVSLFSMGYEYAVKHMDLEDCIRSVSKIGYHGIELVSAQMVPDYPSPGDDWCAHFKHFLEKESIEPVAYGSYVDLARFSDHDLSEDEIYEYVFNDMLMAKKLGFGILKVNDLIGANVLQRLIPQAKRMNLWIGIELHQPNTIHDEKWRAYFDIFNTYGGKYAGVVPDTGIFLSYPHEIFHKEMLESGICESDYQAALQCFLHHDLTESLISLSVPGKECFDKMRMMFTPVPMEDFKAMLKYSRYIHGKFFFMDAHFMDASIHFEEIVKEMKACNFSGYINAEYEGYFHDISQNTQQQLRRFYEMMSKLISERET